MWWLWGTLYSFSVHLYLATWPNGSSKIYLAQMSTTCSLSFECYSSFGKTWNIWGGGILGFCFECPYCASRNILFSVPFHNVLLICTLMKLDAPSRKFHCMNTLGIKTFFFGSLFCLVFLPCLVWQSGQFNKKWKTCAVRIIKWSRLPKVGYYVFQYSFQKYRFEIQIWWIRWAADISFQFTLLQWIGRSAGI